MKRLIALIFILLLTSGALADETEMWVMCQPDSYVNVREFPKKDSREVGRYELGDKVYATGKKRNGYFHCNVYLEPMEAWIKGEFLSDEEPEIYEDGKTYVTTRNNVMARFSMRKGKNVRTKIKRRGTEVKVYGITSAWAVTNYGYIQSQFLEVWDGS